VLVPAYPLNEHHTLCTHHLTFKFSSKSDFFPNETKQNPDNFFKINISFSIDTRPVTKLVTALRDSSSVNKLFKL
jgi:hypothetical protein